MSDDDFPKRYHGTLPDGRRFSYSLEALRPPQTPTFDFEGKAMTAVEIAAALNARPGEASYRVTGPGSIRAEMDRLSAGKKFTPVVILDELSVRREKRKKKRP